MEKNIKDYISLYPECELSTVDGNGINLGFYYPEVWTSQGRVEANGVNVLFKSGGALKDKVFIINFNQCKLLLRPLSDITEKEAAELDDYMWEEFELAKTYNKEEILKIFNPDFLEYRPSYDIVVRATNWLRRNAFDCDKLIEAGLAIDKTKLVK